MKFFYQKPVQSEVMLAQKSIVKGFRMDVLKKFSQLMCIPEPGAALHSRNKIGSI